MAAVAREVAAARGDADYGFTDGEVDTIAAAWGGGSLRRLRSLMGKVADKLATMPTPH